MSGWRQSPDKLSSNTRLRLSAALIAAALIVTGANRYLDLGWFGSHGRQVSAIANFLVLIYVFYVVPRYWRRNNGGSTRL
jgi:hypothetical protein